MNKALTFETSYRASYPVVNLDGVTTQHYVGWVKTDASVKLLKDVKSITPNQSKQMAEVLNGNLEDLNPDAPTRDFYLATGVPGGDETKFLGYFNSNSPALGTVIQRMWSKMVFTKREDS